MSHRYRRDGIPVTTKKMYSAESQLRFLLGSNSSRGVFFFQFTKTIHLFTILVKNIWIFDQRFILFMVIFSYL